MGICLACHSPRTFCLPWLSCQACLYPSTQSLRSLHLPPSATSSNHFCSVVNPETRPNMTPRVFTVLCMVLASTVLAASAVSPSTAGRQATREDFIRMRCNTNKAMDTMLSWTGSSYSLEPQKEQRQLFDLFGINVARCWFDDASQSWMFIWSSLSRQ